MITLIAACSINRVIGANNKLIWRVPGDLKRFKEMTTGHTVLMGRKTFESIGKPLPDRRNIVISRNPKLKCKGCLNYTDLRDTIDMFKNDLYIIGGGEIYVQSFPYADKIELTLIHKTFKGDAYIPEIPDYFIEICRVDMECEEFKYSYITYIKKINSLFASK